MLSFIGLGLYDDRSITLQGREALDDADAVFAECYTSFLAGATVDDIEAAHDVDITVRDRAGVERDPEPILDAAAEGHAAFLTAGDTMISTTHVDLRLRAIDRGIDTRVIHGTTAQTAASSLTGLQNYRFGKATTLPFERSHGGEGVPGSVLGTIEENTERDLHTLVYLDIDRENEAYMTGDHATRLLGDAGLERLGVVIAQAGSGDPTVAAGSLGALADRSFGDPLHMLVVPGELHPLERDALRELGGASV
jgi:diphthine synthase